MQEYISKQHQILRPAEQIYAVISRFDNNEHLQTGSGFPFC